MPRAGLHGCGSLSAHHGLAVAEFEQGHLPVQGVDAQHEVVGPVAQGKGQPAGPVDVAAEQFDPHPGGALGQTALPGDEQGEVLVGLDVVEEVLVAPAEQAGEGAGEAHGQGRDELRAVLENARLAFRAPGRPVAGDRVEMGRGVGLFRVEEVVAALEEQLGELLHLAGGLQGHVEQAAGGEQPAHLVEYRFHGRPVQAAERGLEQVALDGGLEAEPVEHLGQELDAQGAAVVGAGAAGKVEGQVVVLDLLAAERVHGGEMVAEAHAQVQVVAGQDGVAGPAQAGVLLGSGPGGHEREEVGAAQADGARPVDARVAEAAPQGDKGHAGRVVDAHRVAGGQPVAQAAAHVQGVDNERHVHLQAHRVLGAADGLAQVEHLPHRHFVAVADDVVHGAAVVRGELVRVRVGEIEW